MRVLKPFDYFEPGTVKEAAQLLSTREGKARVLAGGIDLIPRMRIGKKEADCLVNIQKIPGLEAIEAHWLFSIPFEKIDIVIHPKSIVHSLVEFVDGNLKAQLSLPDMRLPIQYALSYPERLPNREVPRLDLAQIKTLTFESVDYANLPCLALALEAGKKGGTYPAVLCAADEIAVELFLTGQIRLPQIAEIISATIAAHESVSSPDLSEILGADAWARETALQIANKRSICC